MMTVGRRIALAFGLLLVGGGALSAFVYRTTEKLIEDNAWVVHTRVVIELLETVSRSTNRAEASALNFVLTGDESQLSVLATARQRSDAATHALARHTGDNLVQQKRVAEISVHSAQVFEALAFLTQTRNDVHAAQGRSSAYSGALNEVRRIVEAMRETERQLLEQRVQSASSAASKSLQVIVWGGVAIVAACVVIGVLLTLSVVRPVNMLLRGAAELGAGNLQHRTSTGGADELGTLADAFNKMAESLSRTMVTADTERAARARIERLLNTISETAAHLVSSTTEIVAATSQQAAGAQEQVAAVTQTVATVSEVVQSSQQARERALVVAEMARASAEHGQSGRLVVQESLAAMQRVRELVECSTLSTQTLAATSDAIGSVILSVADIAEQTNVLALNAALEASRAGAHGATFRIVVTEIKRLATQTKLAATEVRGMVEAVQKASGTLLAISHESSRGVVAASEVIARADKSISALAEVIEQASQNAAQIAASTGQQEAGTSQIHFAMSQIREVTIQNLSSTRQMEEAANDLSALGFRLRADLTDAEGTAA